MIRIHYSRPSSSKLIVIIPHCITIVLSPINDSYPKIIKQTIDSRGPDRVTIIGWVNIKHFIYLIEGTRDDPQECVERQRVAKRIQDGAHFNTGRFYGKSNAEINMKKHREMNGI